MLQRVISFALEILLATGLFIVIALAAVALHEFMEFCETRKVHVFIINGLKIVKFTIFGVDVTLFLIYLARTSIDLGKALWKR
jgi:hypothetical protein